MHRGERLIPREEPFASEQVLDSLRELGVDVRARRPRRPGSLATAPSRSRSTTAPSIEADELLVAFGRDPGTHGIGLESSGTPRPARRCASADDLRVPGHDWLFAIGDVNGRAQLTHMGKYQGRIAADAILGRKARLRSDGARPPRVIFTDPQVGAVGLTLRGRAGGRHQACVTSTSRPATTRVARSSATVRRGTSRLVVDEDRRVIVGATITAPRSPKPCMRPRSPSSPRSRSTISGTPCPRSPRAASCGCDLFEAYGL